MKFSEMIETTRDVVELFEQVEPRTWGVEAMMTELAGEVGTLADTIMIKEGYRAQRPGTVLDLDDDLADILFMLIRIAEHYQIDLEQAYQDMIGATRAKLEKQIQEKK